MKLDFAPLAYPLRTLRLILVYRKVRKGLRKGHKEKRPFSTRFQYTGNGQKAGVFSLCPVLFVLFVV